MKQVIGLLVCLIGVVLLVKALPVLMFFLPGSKGELLETWETSNTPFKIRVNKHAESNGGFVPGAYYVFQSSVSGTDNWREIMTFRHDDMVEIPREQIRFANEQVAYVYMGWMYAVTTDGGAKWNVSAISDLIPDGSNCGYDCIKDFQIDSNGMGEAKLRLIGNTKNGLKVYEITDFGKSWREK